MDRPDTRVSGEMEEQTSRGRMMRAMRLEIPDRVPVMCQLSVGHYFLHTDLSPLDIWFTSEGFADALVALQRRYAFDGILVNLPGRDPGYERYIRACERLEHSTIIRWTNGNYTVVPNDDNPHYYQADGTRRFPLFTEIDPDRLYYVDPWNLTEAAYPAVWDFETEPRSNEEFFPPYHLDSIRAVRRKAGTNVSVHSEVFSPWSQFLELLNYEQALLAMMDDPGKVKSCLEHLAAGAADLAKRQAACGVDAILISSAFAGAGFISRAHYEEFVLPYERALVQELRAVSSLPVYTHTCGSIGDRLDLMLATGTNGIDTLDPPPLGTVDLAEAKQTLTGHAFIKGNIDPVNTLLQGSCEMVRKDVRRRIEIGSPGGGYILSSACSVAPRTSPKNIELLAELAAEFGKYA